ncbi:CPBP family intramembrane glutamic endopeptidase [Haladaptatus sp. NG-WS-4]
MTRRRRLESTKLPFGRESDLWGYLLFSHGWAWGWWSINVVAGFDAFSVPGVVFTVLGGLGPPLGGVVMSWATYGREGVRELRRRITDVRRISLRWFAVVFFLVPALTALTAGVAAISGIAADPLELEELTDLLSNPTGLVAYAGFVLVLGPLPEEIGWRGYLLDRLQLRRSALTSSVLLGLVWASWHAPLFLMPGYYSGVDFAPEPLSFAFNIVVGSIIYTWIFNNTRRSVLGAIGYHFAENFTGQVVSLAPAAETLRTGITVAFVLVVLRWWGPTSLRRDEPRPLPPNALPSDDTLASETTK